MKGIFKQDYLNLSSEDKIALKELQDLESKLTSIKGIIKLSDTYKVKERIHELVLEKPYLLNCISIFPNNFLNEHDIVINENDYKIKVQNFTKLINTKDTGERAILNFIRENEAHFIIGSILQNYTGYGHHDRYIFQEFQLPPNYQVDFLIIGKNSMGFHFLFIELEKPYGNITVKNGAFGDTIRKGIEQVNDWKEWIEKNFSNLLNVYDKYKKPKENLPSEFYQYDSTRVEYLVVAGRREDFNEKTNRLRREKRKNSIKILHYDNLIDESKRLLKTNSY